MLAWCCYFTFCPEVEVTDSSQHSSFSFYSPQEKNAIFSDSRREKDVRGALKTDALRVLNKDDLVILDAANYIKGYRYGNFAY